VFLGDLPGKKEGGHKKKKKKKVVGQWGSRGEEGTLLHYSKNAKVGGNHDPQPGGRPGPGREGGAHGKKFCGTHGVPLNDETGKKTALAGTG